jgi:hypothetical protein
MKYPDTAPRLDVLYKIKEWCDGRPGNHRWTTDRTGDGFVEQSCICGASLRAEIVEINDDLYKCTTIYEKQSRPEEADLRVSQEDIERLYINLIQEMDRVDAEFRPPTALGHVNGRRYVSADGMYFVFDSERHQFVRELDGYQVNLRSWERYNRDRLQRTRGRAARGVEPYWDNLQHDGIQYNAVAVPPPPPVVRAVPMDHAVIRGPAVGPEGQGGGVVGQQEAAYIQAARRLLNNLPPQQEGPAAPQPPEHPDAPF